MARKTLEDFDGDYQAYADYLESPECTNDDEIDIVADEKENIFTPTDGDWTKGHGHNNVHDPRPAREPDDPKSYGRKWYNLWLIYSKNIILSQEEAMLLIHKTEEKNVLKLKK